MHTAVAYVVHFHQAFLMHTLQEMQMECRPPYFQQDEEKYAPAHEDSDFSLRDTSQQFPYMY